MRRREFLLRAVPGAFVETAGCVDGLSSTAESPTTSRGRTGVERGGLSGVIAGADLPAPKKELKRSVGKDDIPAIVEPAFADDWSGLVLQTVDRFSGERTTIEPRLTPADTVIGVERDGRARAYPLRVLNWHEIVNDEFDGPLLVTYCPLCRSGITAKRTVRRTTTNFGVSGYLWQSNLVMYDELTRSLWSQIAATAINGPMTGTTLELVPSTITTWAAWRDERPETEILLPPPKSNTVVGRDTLRNYLQNPYARYDDSSQIGIGENEFTDDRLHPKAIVIGVTAGGEAKAYPLAAVTESGVVNDTVGDLPIVVAVAPGETLVAYERTLDSVLRFEAVDVAWMRAGGSKWKISTGRAADGPYDGTQLDQATDIPQLFWFSWLDFHPDTAVYTPNE